MVDIVKPLEPTGLMQHDIKQFTDCFVSPVGSSVNQSLTTKRQNATLLFKQKLRHGQVFFELTEGRDGINKLTFLGWITLVNGSQAAIFQNGHAVISRSSFLRDLRDTANAPLTGYYLDRHDAERVLADFYEQRLNALRAGHDHGDCNHRH
ncbi:hypothetical protein NVP1215B_060 [Vibrio phage 1.215.B._10N.222.54.F7]|nr:hypothetical protein NVP1215A_060 [Vibrio phage 1.215.A._10N.222.54.F7]AUR96083.1 hypothetical protein NVP1215B_060 [Vibrio phage 1.215.B._10N.222.54.F7]